MLEECGYIHNAITSKLLSYNLRFKSFLISFPVFCSRLPIFNLSTLNGNDKFINTTQ